MKVRRAKESEFLDVYRFVCGCAPLERYYEHFYKIMLRYFGNSSFIAEDDGAMVGFVMLLPSGAQEGTYFLWQIGVSAAMQGLGLGKMLLHWAEEEVKKLGGRRIEVTVDPENSPSRRIFEAMGYENISRKEGKTVVVNGNEAVKDYYKPGRHFMLYEKQIGRRRRQ
jgi:L-2,4-diaminobutyric acid acetyltransferase